MDTARERHAPRQPDGMSSGPEERVEKASDDGWKRRAEEEKKRLSRSDSPEAERDLPPASFAGLLEELSIRALVALGQIQNPLTGEASLDLESARYSIDLLGVLEEKSRGNLTAGEKAYLARMLGDLRLAFVEVSKHAAEAREASPSPGLAESTGRDQGAAKPKLII